MELVIKEVNQKQVVGLERKSKRITQEAKFLISMP